ncbi:MAG: PIG-L family deacetylase, partial [Actinomycetota bacterium]|nr:PIG-L family deacetylase [Actinomycetota bacterium]
MQHIYLSPHFDDVVYSCGGMVHRQSWAGEAVHVVTVFAGVAVYGAVSPLAGRLHRDWHQGADAMQQRAREDSDALRVLGATGERWTFPDAIYRQAANGAFLYPTFEALFQNRHVADQALAGVIARRLRRLAARQGGVTVFYAPLGIGGHVDHGLVYEAARDLLMAGCTVLFYEDLPYAANSSVLLGRALAADRAIWWQPRGGAIDLRRKVQAMACYPSQSRRRLV